MTASKKIKVIDSNLKSLEKTYVLLLAAQECLMGLKKEMLERNDPNVKMVFRNYVPRRVQKPLLNTQTVA